MHCQYNIAVKRDHDRRMTVEGVHVQDFFDINMNLKREDSKCRYGGPCLPNYVRRPLLRFYLSFNLL